MVDISKLHFLSSLNYLKRSTFCGSATVTLPAYGSAVTYTVTHNLGYIPFFATYAELDEVDTIWSGGKVSTYTDQDVIAGFSVDPPYPKLDSWSDTTTLTIRLDNHTSPTATGTRVIYWVIYKDYGNV